MLQLKNVTYTIIAFVIFSSFSNLLFAQPLSTWLWNQNQKDIYNAVSSGRVGIGLSNPLSKLDINGGLSIGSYAGVNAAPTNGMIISGNVGLGTTNPSEMLDVYGNITTGGLSISGWQNGSGKLFINLDGIPSQWDGGISLSVTLPQVGVSVSNIIQTDEGLTMKSDDGYVFYNSLGTLLLKLLATGNVGIGTDVPTAKLDVRGKVYLRTSSSSTDIFTLSGYNQVNTHVRIGVAGSAPGAGFFSLIDRLTGSDEKIVFQAAGTSYINTDGLAIGKTTISSGYKFDVAGKIRANEIVVNTTGADFVFKDNYELKPLGEVAEFIENNGHLPEIPTAEEVQENGVKLGEMQTKLLQKIEELTLYIIEQEKRIKTLETELQN